MNISSALFQGTKILKSNSIITADIDAEILMAKAINKDREYILINSTQKVDTEALNIYKKLIENRSNHKPVAYLTNKKFFWKTEFYVTDKTLIPRPDTELIIENTLNLTKNKNQLRILDVGIGSGCILLSILKERQNFHGTGIDISKNCLNISKINAINLNVDSRLKLFKSNIDKFSLGKYDLIVSNPPYIKKFDLNKLNREVIDYEPKMALDGGLEGLSVIRKVIKKSSELIKIHGKLILEIGYDQRVPVIKMLNENNFYINKIVKDLANNDRCIISTKK